MMLQFTSALFALIASGFGAAAFFVPIPKSIQHIDLGFIDPNVPKPVDDLDRLTNGLNRQGKLAACATVAAIVSAVLQIWILFAPAG